MHRNGPSPASFDLAEARERLASLRGPRFWRGIEELSGDEAFQAFLKGRFPEHTSDWDESLEKGFSRRRFFELSLASLALGGLTACTRQPIEKIVPYVRQPEEIVPGVPLFFATAATLGGYAQGLLAESHEGRPTKVEGNPEHPASLGAATAISQASVLGLYDPDRSTSVTNLGTVNTWTRFVDELQGVARAQRALGGSGLRILARASSSPTLAAQRAKLQELFPRAKWITWESAGGANAVAGEAIARGRALEVRYDLSAADVVLALESDFLAAGPGSLRYARDFSARRRVPQAQTSPSSPSAEGREKKLLRLYAVESTPTPTGAAADHRLPLRASAVPAFVQALAAGLGVAGFEAPKGLPKRAADWAAVAARDLKASAGRAVVLAGDSAAPAVHAACAAINDALGNTGRTVLVTEPVLGPDSDADPFSTLRDLVAEIDAKGVDALLVLGANPVYDAPADLAIEKALLKVPFRAHLGLYADETARYCPWHVPMAHELEAWSDARAFDGTATILQPLIEPLYDGKSAHEVLSVLLDETPKKGYDLVKASWQGARPAAAFEPEWRRWLHDGVIPGSAFAPLAAGSVPASAAAAAKALATAAASTAVPAAASSAPEGKLELAFRPDPSILDGRFANNGWLQELPKPMSKLTWDNAAVLSPATAERLGIRVAAEAGGDVPSVTVSTGGRKATLPVLVQPGQADGVVTVALGFGRTYAGKVGNGVGVNVSGLRTSLSPWLVPNVEVVKEKGSASLSHTQQHFRMEGRELLRVGTLAEWVADPAFAKKAGDLPPKEASLFASYEYKEYAWGLSVDLSSCIGCNACVVACQAENNIPVVGKEQVGRGREMHWLRIDQYYEGSLDDPSIHHQPVMCQHCENAPCEVVCPVAATVHSAEGLNDMVYNRCVGTRYCSNNCPYKVRRFNFFEYNGDVAAAERMGKNPDVTVRSRGVMEKCTFCVQRINRAKIAAEKEGRGVRDGDIRTACQQTCPTDAIRFGNLNDPTAEAARRRADGRTYWLLDELNTRPRTSYMARVVNPNPEMKDAAADGRKEA